MSNAPFIRSNRRSTGRRALSPAKRRHPQPDDLVQSSGTRAVTRGVRAAVMSVPRQLELQTFAFPRVEPGAVVMRVTYSGICGTDKHTFRGETRQYSGTPHERTM